MVIAQAWGIVRFILDLVYPVPACGPADDRPAFLRYFHEYYHSTSEILLCFAVAAVVSLITKPIPKENVSPLMGLHILQICLFLLCFATHFEETLHHGREPD